MARPLRIEYEGAWYHVMNRGLARDFIFLNDKHRQMFLDLLLEVHERYCSIVHAYCLMDNHYHLLIQTPLGNISRIMRHLDGVYTQRFNRDVKRDGPLFRGRFKAILVEADNYFLELSRYIHLNPVKAKLVSKPENYKWSSYLAYFYDTHKPWLNTRYILGYFEHNLQKYKAFVEECDINEIEDFSNLNNPILGTNEFIKFVAEKYLKEQHKICDIPQHKLLINSSNFKFDMDKIAILVEAFYSKNSNDSKNFHIFKNEKARLKIVVMYLAEMLGQYTLSQIAKFMNVTTSRVSKARKKLQQHMQDDNYLKEEIKELYQFVVNESKVKT